MPRPALPVAGPTLEDRLTGLPSRKRFERLAEVAWPRAAGSPVSLILADIDHCARVNMEHGHLAGDDLIGQVADLVRLAARPGDVSGRVAGETFAILLPGAALDTARATAEMLRRTVGALQVATEDGVVMATVSIGVAETSGAANLAGLMQRADDALFEAKRLGRNRVETPPAHPARQDVLI